MAAGETCWNQLTHLNATDGHHTHSRPPDNTPKGREQQKIQEKNSRKKKVTCTFNSLTPAVYTVFPTSTQPPPPPHLHSSKGRITHLRVRQPFLSSHSTR